MSNSESVISIQNVQLTFGLSANRAWSIREEFIDFMKNPVTRILRSRDRFQVLKQINLEIRAGDRIAILGRNGAGKTTLARCIAGIYHPQAGKIIRRGQVRAVFDTNAGLYPDLSGRENIRILIRFLYPSFRTQFKNIEEDVINFSGLGVHIDSPFRVYSNGMQARLGLALVTSRPSDVIILDEVFDGADRFFREKMRERLDSFLDHSKSVLFISHAMDQVREICNRAIVLEDGVIQYDGSPDDAIKFYETLSARE